MFNHIRVWNMWRKLCYNNLSHKTLVLLGLRVSPTFEYMKMFDRACRDLFDVHEERRKKKKNE